MCTMYSPPSPVQYYSGSGRLLIGALNAGSNITGVLTDTDTFSSLLHRYGALAFWDYAAAAPYVNIDMNSTSSEGAYKDGVYFSVHKFVGGAGTPGMWKLVEATMIPSGNLSYNDLHVHIQVFCVQRTTYSGTAYLIFQEVERYSM